MDSQINNAVGGRVSGVQRGRGASNSDLRGNNTSSYQRRYSTASYSQNTNSNEQGPFADRQHCYLPQPPQPQHGYDYQNNTHGQRSNYVSTSLRRVVNRAEVGVGEDTHFDGSDDALDFMSGLVNDNYGQVRDNDDVRRDYRPDYPGTSTFIGERNNRATITSTLPFSHGLSASPDTRDHFRGQDSSRGYRDPIYDVNENRVPAGTDTRAWITPTSDKKNFEQDGVVRSTATRCIVVDFKAGTTGLKTVDHVSYERWLTAFKRLYRWLPEHDIHIQKIFREKCGSTIRNGFYGLRKGKCKHGPRFSNPDANKAALEYSKTSLEFSKLSDQNIKNCKGGDTNRGNNQHRGGPHHIAWWKNKMSMELGRNPSPGEMYKRLKVMPDGRYLDPVGEEQMRSYEEREKAFLVEHPEQDTIPQVESLEMFTKSFGVRGRDKLPRVIGGAATEVPGSKYFNSSETMVSPLSQDVFKSLFDSLISHLDRRFDELKSSPNPQPPVSVEDSVLNRVSSDDPAENGDP